MILMIKVLRFPEDVVRDAVENGAVVCSIEECERRIDRTVEVIQEAYERYARIGFESELAVQLALLVVPYGLERTFIYEGLDYPFENAFSKRRGIYVFVMPVSAFDSMGSHLTDLEDTVLHEMIHEFEEYCVITEEGKAAYESALALPTLIELDKDHAEGFFSALCRVAKNMGLEWSELFNKIRS